MTRVEIHVVWQAQRWWVTVSGLRLPEGTRAAAMLHARALAEDHASGGGLAEVLVHRRDGTIGQRSTYPRSSDPRASRG